MVIIASSGQSNAVGRGASGEWYEHSSGRLEQAGIAYLEYVNDQTLRGVWEFPHDFISMPLDISHAIIGDALTTPRTMNTSDANWLQVSLRLVGRNSVEIRMRNLNPSVNPFIAGEYLMLSMRASGHWK